VFSLSPRAAGRKAEEVGRPALETLPHKLNPLGFLARALERVGDLEWSRHWGPVQVAELFGHVGSGKVSQVAPD